MQHPYRVEETLGIDWAEVVVATTEHCQYVETGHVVHAVSKHSWRGGTVPVDDPLWTEPLHLWFANSQDVKLVCQLTLGCPTTEEIDAFNHSD